MKHIERTALALILAATFCVSSGCDPKEEPLPVQPPPVAVPKGPEATAERALERARARWALGVKADWVSVFDFAAPEAQRERPLAAFLAGMQMHKYENMRATEVVAVQGNNAYVRVVGLWTPLDPRLKNVKREPGQTFTQDIEMIESWRFIDDWYHVRSQRPDEFYETHPDLLKKGAPDSSEAAPSVPPAK